MASSRRRFLLGVAAAPIAAVLPKAGSSDEPLSDQDNSGIPGFDRLMEAHAAGLISDWTVMEIMRCEPDRLSFKNGYVYLHWNRRL